MSLSSRHFLVLLPLITAIAAPPVYAQDNSDAVVDQRPELVEQLFNCRKVENDEDRLGCFDNAVAAVEQAEVSDELVIADRTQIKEAKRGLFGFRLPRIGLFDRKNDSDEDREEDEINSIESTIASASRNWQGQLSFVLEDGARWRQTDKNQVYGDIGKGTQVTISRAALGSFKAKIGRKRAFRVERVN